MPASKLSHFPFYFRDYLLSKTRLRFTPSQRGAYIDILCLCYDSDDGYIEWDTDYFVNLTGATKEDITAVQRAFNECSTGVNGRWTHPRVLAEREKMTLQHEAAKRAGKVSANKRLGNGRSTGVQRAKKAVQPTEQNITVLSAAQPPLEGPAAPQPDFIDERLTHPENYTPEKFAEARRKIAEIGKAKP